MKLLLAALSVFALTSPLFPAVALQASTPAKATMTRTLDITANQTASNLTVQAGDVLRFHLPTQAGTGYSWRAVEVEAQYLVLIDKTNTPPPVRPAGSPPPVGGAGPTVTYVYYVKKALTQGTARFAIPVSFIETGPGQSPETVPLLTYTLTSK
ncbi:protease inhibitor I42 family protein [Deinococcus oregonensis]|uniref:Protease inhibitor I42 family protein n=1 Tax=Deinococcus oregonensis TaxID=1805970 RepID=A0ABV6B1D6_9DEIO